MKKRIIAALLALIIILTVALSAVAVVLEATHDCSGNNCDICGILKLILFITRAVCLTACLTVLWSVNCAARSFSQFCNRFSISYSNPVSQKVRLLN